MACVIYAITNLSSLSPSFYISFILVYVHILHACEFVFSIHCAQLHHQKTFTLLYFVIWYLLLLSTMSILLYVCPSSYFVIRVCFSLPAQYLIDLLNKEYVIHYHLKSYVNIYILIRIAYTPFIPKKMQHYTFWAVPENVAFPFQVCF